MAMRFMHSALRAATERLHEPPGHSLTVFPMLVGALGLFTSLTLLGCKDLTGSQALPSGTPNPASYSTPAGALGMRTAALNALEQVLPAYLTDAGLLTDELESNTVGVSPGIQLSSSLPPGGSLDARILPEQSFGVSGTAADQDYGRLQKTRGYIDQALGALAAYDTGAHKQGDPVALRSELFALQGYAEILLADFFCSGVPLSTLDFQMDFTYQPSSTTTQVYQDALIKEDSALALARVTSDSVRLQNLARVLTGRALLALGQYAQAAHAVAAVPDGFQFQLAVQWTPPASSGSNLLALSATVADNEGLSGLPYVSSSDPRTTVVTVSLNTGVTYPVPPRFPAKYTPTGFSPFPVTDWIEARLIQAEAALRTNPSDPTWLTILNTLRTSGTPDSVTWIDTLGVTAPPYGTIGRLVSQVVGAVYNRGTKQTVRFYTIDTYLRPIWSAGTGGVSGLYPFTDPVDPAARVDMLFTERAAWLFLTGHRQGDLRRLIRQYGRQPDQVYPTGAYLGLGTARYGTDVTAPIPGAEYANPLFHGCRDRLP